MFVKKCQLNVVLDRRFAGLYSEARRVPPSFFNRYYVRGADAQTIEFFVLLILPYAIGLVLWSRNSKRFGLGVAFGAALSYAIPGIYFSVVLFLFLGFANGNGALFQYLCLLLFSVLAINIVILAVLENDEPSSVGFITGVSLAMVYAVGVMIMISSTPNAANQRAHQAELDELTARRQMFQIAGCAIRAQAATGTAPADLNHFAVIPGCSNSHNCRGVS